MKVIPPYKEFQYLYRDLVDLHEDDIDKVESITTENTLEEKLRGALEYFKAKSLPIIYPGKAYGVALVYALNIERDYGIPIRETLSDSDLFMGEDRFFVTYDQDPETYEALIERLKEFEPNDVTQMGWAEQTSRYYWLECTPEGIAHVMTYPE